ncbi:hypothetical protein ACLB2K_005622 [Fragaria x ananassa]
MGCVVSKKNEGDDVVWLCKERKRQLKLAVERRYGFAEAQCKYNQSLYSVAAAIRLFVARHSSPSSPFLITFPSVNLENAEPIVQNNPMLLQQRPSEPMTHKTIGVGSVCDSVKLQEDPDGKSESDQGEVVCEHFHDVVESPERDFGWDFFYPFYDGVRAELVNGFDEDLRAVREKEGIPELEEVGEGGVISEEKVGDLSNCDVGDEEESGGVAVSDGNGNQEGERSLRVIDTPKEGRELLEALRDVEDHFMKAYDSGLDVSRMLETNMVQMQSALEEIKGNSTKLIRSITRSRSTTSTLSWSSSGKSSLTSSSKSSSAWTQISNDLFDDYGAMGSGNHSLTLGRLYAWEKKLFQEVKAGEETRKIYERKCSQLRDQDVRGDGLNSRDKVGVEIKDLYARILVSIRSAESISQRIEKLRDEELQPQLIELLKGLMINWQIMSELHETQNKIMSEKAYIEALHGWLLKFIAPETEFYLKGMSPLPSCTLNGPPLLAICHNWLTSMDKLPDGAVTSAMKSFGKDIRALLAQQGEEHQQKRKVDGLARELDKKVLAFERTERRLLGVKFSEKETELHVPNRIEYLTGMKDQLDMFRKKLDTEKAKHQTSMQETQHIAVNGFQTGFTSVFESLAEFSKTATRLYADIITFGENDKGVDEKSSNPS